MCLFLEPQQWTTVPLLVKMYKLLINELSNQIEEHTSTRSQDADNDSQVKFSQLFFPKISYIIMDMIIRCWCNDKQKFACKSHQAVIILYIFVILNTVCVLDVSILCICVHIYIIYSGIIRQKFCQVFENYYKVNLIPPVVSH